MGKYRIVTQNGEIIQEDFRSYLYRKRAIDWKQHLSKIPYYRYWKYLLGRIQSYLRIDNMQLLYQRIERLLELLVKHTMVELTERFYELITDENEESSSDVNWQEYDALMKSPSNEVSV